jgi:hypothetical protein
MRHVRLPVPQHRPCWGIISCSYNHCWCSSQFHHPAWCPIQHCLLLHSLLIPASGACHPEREHLRIAPVKPEVRSFFFVPFSNLRQLVSLCLTLYYIHSCSEVWSRISKEAGGCRRLWCIFIEAKLVLFVVAWSGWAVTFSIHWRVLWWSSSRDMSFPYTVQQCTP